VSNMIAGSLDTASLSVQHFTLAGENINTKLSGLDQSASVSATLGTQITQLQTNLESLTNRVASLEATLAQTENDPVGTFHASSSAELSLDSLEVNGGILADNLSVLGYTTMNELSVTGSIRTGVLTIKGQSNGGASISTLNGDLRLQEQGFGGIDILDGLITIDTDGNMQSKGEITATKLNIDETNTLSASVGQGTIPLNATNAIIQTTAVTSDSHIFITPRTKTNLQISVTTQTNGTSFKVEITSPAPQPIKFDWWIVN
jgi:TolA-binding protein